MRGTEEKQISPRPLNTVVNFYSKLRRYCTQHTVTEYRTVIFVETWIVNQHDIGNVD